MPNRFSHGLTYDVFVSYSSSNAGWVTEFCEDLKKDLVFVSGKEVEIFLDQDRLSSGDLWNEKILASVVQSAVFVPVLSPGFIESKYCGTELRAFLDEHGRIVGTSHKGRVLSVELLSEAKSHTELKGFQATSFFEQSGPVLQEFRRGHPSYSTALRALSTGICEVLKMLLGRQAVYVGATWPELDGDVARLVESLSHLYDVRRPDEGMLARKTSSQIRECVADDLKRCFASVHTLTAEGDAPLLTAIVNAEQATAGQAGKPRLLWEPRRAEGVDEKRQDLKRQGFDWFDSQADLEDHLRRISRKPRPRQELDAIESQERLIYLLCRNRPDKDSARDLIEALRRCQCNVFSPDPSETSLEQHEVISQEFSELIHGLLIYYGDATSAWFIKAFKCAQKLKSRRPVPAAVYLAPPPSDYKTKDVPDLPLLLLDPANASVDEIVRPFVERL
jgi:hypothetical protein